MRDNVDKKKGATKNRHVLLLLYYSIKMSIARERSIKVPTENRRARLKVVILESSFSSEPRLFPHTFLLVESRRAFSGTSPPRVVTMWRTFFTGDVAV